MKMIVSLSGVIVTTRLHARYADIVGTTVYREGPWLSAIFSPLPPARAMDVLDTRQWDELASASSSPLQPWPPIVSYLATMRHPSNS
jgi:hypothetical protein